ncbi:MAG: chaperone modulator CbpM [Verrucomicrobia bacterium]|nr:chaperone modulator CbpM [Verrucomicrobiota bacterium]MBU4428617.1 chaperone modulator CbpM [Verrucomicrobiota bacterium]
MAQLFVVLVSRSLSTCAFFNCRRWVRLHYGLGIDFPSIPIVLDLLDRIADLEKRLADLESCR